MIANINQFQDWLSQYDTGQLLRLKQAQSYYLNRHHSGFNIRVIGPDKQEIKTRWRNILVLNQIAFNVKGNNIIIIKGE